MTTFSNLQLPQQPFTEVTLQMSHSKVPTIPFVLPLYQKMEKHLEAVSISWEHSFKIQRAARQGLTKLSKYFTPAKLQHSYIIGTGKLCHLLNLKQTRPHCIVLHPCLRSHWFAATADPNDVAAQEEAIATAEVIFKYVAETYLETATSPASTAVPRPLAKPVVKKPSFLASACAFQRPTTATTTVPILKRTPKEALADELTRYINFEAMPRQE